MTTSRLKVTSIERYHLCDDTPENPNVIGCELTVSGNVDLDIATAAVRDIAKRHPLAYARLKGQYWCMDPADRDRLSWQVVETNNLGEPDRDVRAIDLATQFPCQFILRKAGEVTHLSFRTHHAAADGGGGLQFVVDWLLTYHRISTGSDRPKSRETNPEILDQRNNLRLLNREFIGKLWIQPIAILGATKFLYRRVTPVTDKPAETANTKSPNDFQVLTSSLSAQQIEQLKSEAAQHKATINELILRAVFLGVHEFRKRHGFHKHGEWLRLIIPISIRDFADRRLPAANRATIVQLDRRDRDFADPPGMMWGLNYELGNIKKWNLEKTFLLLMRCFSVIPGFVGRSARKDVCRATSVVTNLGAPFERLKLERIDGKLRSGNLIVEDAGLDVPLRKNTPVGFAVMRYAGRQKICLHYDPRQIEKRQAEEVQELVMKWLTQQARE